MFCTKCGSEILQGDSPKLCMVCKARKKMKKIELFIKNIVKEILALFNIKISSIFKSNLNIRLHKSYNYIPMLDPTQTVTPAAIPTANITRRRCRTSGNSDGQHFHADGGSGGIFGGQYSYVDSGAAGNSSGQHSPRIRRMLPAFPVEMLVIISIETK